MLDHIDFIRDDEADPASNGPEVFIVSIRHPKTRRSRKLWVAMHINPAQPDLIICEFEVDDDQVHPLVPVPDQADELPEDTLKSNPTQEEFNESTLISSKPLRVLRNARKRKGEAAAMEVFNIMSQVQEQLADAPNLELFLKILVGVVKELTGFHRVMIYQFDTTYNGRVVTELVDPRATKDLYKGLNFPASDIPKQARDLYKINKVRLLYDRDMETARLVCRGTEELERPLDLSFSYLVSSIFFCDCDIDVVLGEPGFPIWPSIDDFCSVPCHLYISNTSPIWQFVHRCQFPSTLSASYGA